MKTKFWDKVEQKLLILEGNLYFMGRTLSVGLSKDSGIALNLNGVGFVFGKIPQHFNPKVYQPKHITDLVQSVYDKVKEET